MILNQLGEITEQIWLELEQRFQKIKCREFQVMPNHIHFIIEIQQPENVGAELASARLHQNTAKLSNQRAGASPAPTICQIVGAYKSLVALCYLKNFKQNHQNMGKIWQRNYYEHIIRSEETHQKIIEYIINNPVNWADDRLYQP